MRIAIVLLLILIPLKSLNAASKDIRCGNELNELKLFSQREAERLKLLLERTKLSIATLPRFERVRAQVLWTEAEASRRDLEKYLSGPQPATLACAHISEDIRAKLFRAQEFGFQVYFEHDDRARFSADNALKASVKSSAR